MANNIKIENEQVVGQSYSTSEKWTGDYWIDGKKIYRKVFVDNLSTADTSWRGMNINLSTYKIDAVINIFSWITQSSGNIGYGSWNNNSNDFCRWVYTSPNLHIQYGSAFNTNDIIKVILEYTKTTED